MSLLLLFRPSAAGPVVAVHHVAPPERVKAVPVERRRLIVPAEEIEE